MPKVSLELANRSIKNLLPLINHKNPITELLNVAQVVSGQENGCFFLLIDLSNCPTNIVLTETSKPMVGSSKKRTFGIVKQGSRNVRPHPLPQ